MDMPSSATINIDANDLIHALVSQVATGDRGTLDLKTGRVIPSRDAVDDGGEPRYVTIEPLPERVHLLIAGDYVDSLPEDALREQLETALGSDAPLAGMERVLSEYPEDQREWEGYRRTAYREAARNWLEDQGIDGNLIGA